MYAFHKRSERYCGLFNDCLTVCFSLFFVFRCCKKFTFAISAADEFLYHMKEHLELVSSQLLAHFVLFILSYFVFMRILLLIKEAVVVYA